MPEEIALWERGGGGPCRDGGQRQVEQRRGELRVDPLVRLHLTVAEVEECLPADEPAGCFSTAAQVDWVETTLPGGIEDHFEEGMAIVACEVGAIRRTDHAVPKAIDDLKLDGDERLAVLGRVEAAPVGQDVVHHRLPDDVRQELLEDQPMVVVRGEPASLGKGGIVRNR